MVGFSKSNMEPTLKVKFFSAGFAACIGDMITFPLDTSKVRLQIQGEGTGVAAQAAASAKQNFKYRGIVGTLMTISREEGPRAMYNGLSAGLQRQMAFASVRIGLYDPVKGFYQDLAKGGNGGVGLRILAGITTGAMSVTCAQPTDVVKVRMQAQGAGGAPKRYTGSLMAYRTIARQEGVRGLWKGLLPNVSRNAIVNAAELVSYDLIKEFIVQKKLLTDNMPCHFVSAFGAGFCTTVIASPVDVVKTRFMNSGAGMYKGALHCAVVMFKEGGPLAFYKGFMPSFMRLGSWNIVMFVSFEQLKRMFMHISSAKSSFPQPTIVPAINAQTDKKGLV